MGAEKSNSSVWITWEIQRRNRSMAHRLGAQLYEFTSVRAGVWRYVSLSWRTIRLLLRKRPDVVYFQNPSIVLCFWICALKLLGLLRSKTVGDFHNAGVYPPVARFLVPWMVRSNDVTIVSNDNLRAVIASMGGKALSIPDPMPQIHAGDLIPPRGIFQIFFVCSWAPDEPICEVLKAATILRDSHPDVRIAISGRPRLERIGWRSPVPDNVVLTGFLTELDFEARLTSCHAILDLTTRDDCMVCGAYEAASIAVPMILSDNLPTKAYFDSGALFTDNSAEDIARQISALHGNHDSLKAGVLALRNRLRGRDEQAIERLRAAIG